MTAAQTDDPNIGRVLIGQYRLQSTIGDGAFGQVYKAERVTMGGHAAVKLLHAHHVKDPDILARFQREAKALAAVQHPNVVTVFNFGEAADDGSLFLAMEFLEGRTMRQLLRADKRLTWRHALRLSGQIADGLHAAHGQGLVHRDLKPENVLLTQLGDRSDVVKVLDFGIALALPAEAPTHEETPVMPTRLTTDGSVHGTAFYMAPEQAMGGAMDHRVDIYALSVMLYEMLSGLFPYDVDSERFDPTNPVALMVAHASGDVVPLRVRPGLERIPARLESLILEGLSREPERRPADMAVFRHRIAECEGLHTAPGMLRPDLAPPIGSDDLVSGVEETMDSVRPVAAPAVTPSPDPDPPPAPGPGGIRRALPIAALAVFVIAAVVFAVNRAQSPVPERPAAAPAPRAQMPPAESAAPAGPAAVSDASLGLAVQDRPDGAAGVRVVEVTGDGRAAKVGLSPRDLLLQLDGAPVGDAKQLVDRLRTATAPLRLSGVGAGGAKLELTWGRRPKKAKAKGKKRRSGRRKARPEALSPELDLDR